MQRNMAPKVNAGTLVFIGDHGVAASPSDEGEGCCAYPQVFMTGIHSQSFTSLAILVFFIPRNFIPGGHTSCC